MIKKIFLIAVLLMLAGCDTNRTDSSRVESSEDLSGSNTLESTSSIMSSSVHESASSISNPEDEISESDEPPPTKPPEGKPDDPIASPPPEYEYQDDGMGNIRTKLFHDDEQWFLIDGKTIGAGPIYCALKVDGKNTILYFSHMDDINRLTTEFPYNLFVYAPRVESLDSNPIANKYEGDYIQIVGYYGDQSGQIQTPSIETRTLTLYRVKSQALLTITHEFSGQPTAQEYYNLADGAFDSLYSFLLTKGQGQEQEFIAPPMG